MKCDGFSPGSKDFAAGLDFIKDLHKKANFDFISCNIMTSESNFLFKEYKIISINNFDIGIIGASSVFNVEGVKVENPFPSINETVAKIKDKCDIVILLFNASDIDYKQIANANLDVDFVVRGNTARKSSDGGARGYPVYSTGDRGKILYQFDFKYNDLSSPLVDIAYYQKNISKNEKRIKQYENNDNMMDKVKNYEISINESNSIINNAKNTLQYKSITLNKMVQDDPYVLKIVDEGKNRLESMFGPLPDPHEGHHHHHHHHGHSH